MVALLLSSILMGEQQGDGGPPVSHKVGFSTPLT